MKYKSQLVTQASGSIGGLTASHNASGLYFRARSIPTNPGSSRQTAVRNALALAAAAWSGELTAANRQLWDQYAKTTPVKNALGDSILLSGINMFIRARTLQSQAGLPLSVDGPPDEGLAVLTLPTVTVAVGTTDTTASVTFTNTDSWATTEQSGLLIYTSPGRSAGINYYKGPYRYAGVIVGDAIAPSPPGTLIDLPFQYSVGQRLFWRAVAVDDMGRQSPVTRGTSLVIAGT